MGSANAKERMQQIIQAQPDDSSYEEILRELAVSHMVERGLDDMRAQKVISNADMERRIHARPKYLDR
jgi:hypothetical protein